MKMVNPRGIIVLAALLAAPLSARAAIIGVAWNGGTTGNNLASTDQPGVVAGANWNQLTGLSGTAVSIHDDTNSQTASLTFSAPAQDGAQNTINTGNAAQAKLYKGCLFGTDATHNPSFTISSVPYATYDLYTYATNDTGNTSTLSISDGSTTFYYRSAGSNNNAATSLTLTTSTAIGSPTAGQAQYQIFHETNAAPVTIQLGGSSPSVIANTIHGFEIVQTPEPASLGLIGVGMLGLLARRRKA